MVEIWLSRWRGSKGIQYGIVVDGHGGIGELYKVGMRFGDWLFALLGLFLFLFRDEFEFLVETIQFHLDLMWSGVFVTVLFLEVLYFSLNLFGTLGLQHSFIACFEAGLLVLLELLFALFFVPISDAPAHDYHVSVSPAVCSVWTYPRVQQLKGGYCLFVRTWLVVVRKGSVIRSHE